MHTNTTSPRPSTARRRRRCRRRRRSSSTSPACTRAPASRRPTSSPSSTPRRAGSCTRCRCRTSATSSTTSAGTAARSACHGPDRSHLIVPGFRSSRIHIVNVADDPRRPRIEKVIEPEELVAKTGYTRPHTVHCMPGDNVVVSMLGDADGQRRRRLRGARREDVRGQGPLGERRRDAAASTTTSGTSRARTCSSRREFGEPNAYEKGFDLDGRRGRPLRAPPPLLEPGRAEAGADGRPRRERAPPARGALAARPRGRGGLRRRGAFERDVALPPRRTAPGRPSR